MSTSRVAVFVAVVFFFGVASAKPFGTINGLGQNNEHEMITRLALQCKDGKSKPPYDCFESISLSNLAGHHVHVIGIPITGAGDNGMVGSPDDLPPEGPNAHFDDADFLDVEGYPQSREQATKQIQASVDHMRMRFGQALHGVDRLLDSSDDIIDDMADLSDDDECDHHHRSKRDNTHGKAKCVVLEGFGRALHGVQDFYAHSNWADKPNPANPISITNPPGLDNGDPAPFLDLTLTGSVADQIPRNLSTGCFVLIGTGCKGRITHDSMNKDHGDIKLDGSIVGNPTGIPRNEVADNFIKAVELARDDTRNRWDELRAEIKRVHGEKKGNKMICALVSDEPSGNC
jgi:hypothetical protein